MAHASPKPNNSHLRDILVLGIPAMLAQASQPILNIAETAMIGRLGATELAARAIGAPLTLIVYSSVGFFRGIQDTRTPLVIVFLITALQLIFDYALIYGNFGLLALGLIGAALAAFILQLGGATIYLALFLTSRQTADYRAVVGRRITIAGLKPLFQIGQDLAIRTGALRLSLVFATSSAARMGDATLAAYEIVFQLFMLCSDVIDGLAIAGQALVAKHLGSHDRDRAYRMGVTLTLPGCLAGLGFALGFAVAWREIVGFFTSSSEVSRLLTSGVMLLVCALQPFNGIVFVLDGLLIGARYTRYLMWAMLAGAAILIAGAWSSLQFDWGFAGNLERHQRIDVVAQRDQSRPLLQTKTGGRLIC